MATRSPISRRACITTAFVTIPRTPSSITTATCAAWTTLQRPRMATLGTVLAAFAAAMPGRVALASPTRTRPHAHSAPRSLGPTLLGELPRGENELDGLFDSYVEHNAAAASARNVSFLPTRAVFFASLIEGWQRQHGAITSDRLHHNENGARLVEALFRQTLLTFYKRAPAQSAG